jgi:hypothetical protein
VENDEPVRARKLNLDDRKARIVLVQELERLFPALRGSRLTAHAIHKATQQGPCRRVVIDHQNADGLTHALPPRS